MKAIKNISILVIALLATTTSYGQNHTTQAYEYYKSGNYDSAKYWIDSAIVSQERYNSQTWQLRGLVYRKLESDSTGNYRKISIESFVQARNLDEDGTYTEKIDNYMKNTIIRYYNDAVTALNAGDLKQSVQNYQSYKTNYQKYLSHLNHNFDKEDYEFYDVIGSAFLQKSRHLSGKQKEEAIANGIRYCEKALEIDSTLYSPNFSLGVLYYNQGADYIMNIDPLTPIEEIPAVEEKAQNDFKKALPHLMRAHEIKPDNADVIEAITGCYFGLYGSEDDRYLKYQKLLDEKRLPELIERHKQDPEDEETLRQLIRIYSTTFKDKDKYLEYSEKLNNLGD